MNEYYWSLEEDNLLKISYANKVSKKDILALFPNRTYASLKHRAKVLKIKKIRLQQKNEAFFDEPNELNCSIAGLIASDGNIQHPSKKNYYRIIFGFCTKDEELLYKINKVTECNAVISKRTINKSMKTRYNPNAVAKDYFSSHLTVSSAQRWIENLEKFWSITPSKSLTLTAPKISDISHQLAYICGLVTGDGTIGIQRTAGKDYFYFKLLGTQDLLIWVKQTFEKVLGEDIRGQISLDKLDSKAFKFQVNGHQAIKLFEKMNSLNCVKLDRKWENPEVLSVISAYKLKFPHLFLNSGPSLGENIHKSSPQL